MLVCRRGRHNLCLCSVPILNDHGETIARVFLVLKSPDRFPQAGIQHLSLPAAAQRLLRRHLRKVARHLADAGRRVANRDLALADGVQEQRRYESQPDLFSTQVLRQRESRQSELSSMAESLRLRAGSALRPAEVGPGELEVVALLSSQK